jgi:hypothetical protein
MERVNVVLSRNRTSKWIISKRFNNENAVCISCFLVQATYSAHPTHSDFTTLLIVGDFYKKVKCKIKVKLLLFWTENRRLGGSQSRSESGDDEKKFPLPFRELNFSGPGCDPGIVLLSACIILNQTQLRQNTLSVVEWRLPRRHLTWGLSCNGSEIACLLLWTSVCVRCVHSVVKRTNRHSDDSQKQNLNVYLNLPCAHKSPLNCRARLCMLNCTDRRHIRVYSYIMAVLRFVWLLANYNSERSERVSTKFGVGSLHKNLSVWTTGFQFLAGAVWDFIPSHRLQTGSGAHAPSYPMGTRDLSPG